MQRCAEASDLVSRWRSRVFMMRSGLKTLVRFQPSPSFFCRILVIDSQNLIQYPRRVKWQIGDAKAEPKPRTSSPWRPHILVNMHRINYVGSIPTFTFFFAVRNNPRVCRLGVLFQTSNPLPDCGLQRKRKHSPFAEVKIGDDEKAHEVKPPCDIQRHENARH